MRYDTDMSGFRERAEARRQSLTGGRAANSEELSVIDLRFWREATPSDRLNAIWLMALESLAMKGKHESAFGLQGSSIGVRRIGG